jgi:hypothetical protein
MSGTHGSRQVDDLGENRVWPPRLLQTEVSLDPVGRRTSKRAYPGVFEIDGRRYRTTDSPRLERIADVVVRRG